MPFAMWASTGLVPQWYMKTPGSLALKRKVNDSPGATSLKALFGAMRAAWKSIECGNRAAVRERHLHRLALANVHDRAGRAWPSNAQALYLTPGAISRVMSFSVICTLTRSPAASGGSVAS